MKPYEGGGVLLDRAGEGHTAAAALEFAVHCDPHHPDAEAIYSLSVDTEAAALAHALDSQHAPKAAFSLPFGAEAGEMVIRALRNAAELHAAPHISSAAALMIQEYEGTEAPVNAAA